MEYDYGRSTLNLMASILKNYGGDPVYQPLEDLDRLNSGGYNHVILMVFDGLGQSLISRYGNELNLPSGVDNRPMVTVFPPTTAAAMTTFYTGNSPREHAYLGWSLWFDELEGSYINVLPGTDSGTNRSYVGSPRDIYDIMPLDSFNRKLERIDPDTDLYFISPRPFRESRYNRAACGPAKAVYYRRFKDMIRAAASSVRKSRKGRSYTMVYHMEPDRFLHPEGLETGRLPDFLTLLGEQLRKLIHRIEGTNTLLLVTADHGMTRTDDYHLLREGSPLSSLLVRPPFPESRMLSFHVKPGREEEFEGLFRKEVGEGFLLMTGEEFLERAWLGPEGPGVVDNIRVKKLIGSHVAIGNGSRGIKYVPREGGKTSSLFKAHHGGMTREEREIPLLIYSGD